MLFGIEFRDENDKQELVEKAQAAKEAVCDLWEKMAEHMPELQQIQERGGRYRSGYGMGWNGNMGSRNYGGGSNYSGRGGNHPYTVDENGEIEMPVLGRIKVGGKTRLEVADLIKYRLLSGEMLADPTVLVEYYDLSFYALGEIGHSGRITIPRDNVTIMEAISLAGDLTISGRRDNVMVLRTENGTQTPYYVDLTNPQSVYSSPVYYLQQNDMIYVEPTALRANQSTLMANQTRNPTFWMSTITSVITFYLFIRTFITNEASRTEKLIP